MQKDEPMCYITYAVPAHMLPQLTIREESAPVNVMSAPGGEEQPALFPEGFMPDWFIRGGFPEDDFED